MAASRSDDSSAGLVARSVQGDNAAPLSITEISTLLKRTVEDRFGHVRLRGELSGVELWRELKLVNQLGVTRGQLDATPQVILRKS